MVSLSLTWNIGVYIKGTALEWFRSYLSDRIFSVSLGDSVSSSAPLPCGVPQRPFLENMASHSTVRQMTHIYLPLKWKDADSLKPLLNCLKNIKAWMALHFLNFNESKTEVLIFGPNGASDALHMDLCPWNHM